MGPKLPGFTWFSNIVTIIVVCQLNKRSVGVSYFSSIGVLRCSRSTRHVLTEECALHQKHSCPHGIGFSLPLPCLGYGLLVLCRKSQQSVKFAISVNTNCGPLSNITYSAIPNHAKCSFDESIQLDFYQILAGDFDLIPLRYRFSFYDSPSSILILLILNHLTFV